MAWIPLRLHSQYSILDSTLSVKTIAQTAKNFAMPAVALTDQGNMFGVVDFYKACKSSGIKAILGCEVWLTPFSRFEKQKRPSYPSGFPFILLVKDKQGYQNLCKITSIGYVEGFYYYPRIDKEVLEKYKDGLICLSGSTKSYLSYLALHGEEKQLLEEVDWFQKLFGEDFYFELQRHQMTEKAIKEDGFERESWVWESYVEFIKAEEKVFQKWVEISQKKSIKCVATNDIHYKDKSDWKAQEILLNVQSGEPCEIWERDSKGNQKSLIPNPKRKILSSREFYFKSSLEMETLFADFPEAILNTVEVANKCDYEFDLKTKHYPIFVPPSLANQEVKKSERKKAAEDYLYQLCQEGITKKYTEKNLLRIKKKYPDQDPLEIVQQRLKYEYEIIVSKGMCDYLLIVHDFISWAKKQKIIVGPGRGSAAGSIVCYLIDITDIEPLQFNLFFERFINPERISYPDIDVDICMERRDEVIDYTIQKYGKDRVAQIITFGTMKAKMAIKDVGRVLSVPLAKVNQITKLVPEELNITIEEALAKDQELQNWYLTDAEVKHLLDIAKTIEGSIRNTSIHAAGLIISEDPITDHVPVCIAKDTDIVVTQFAMKQVEMVGMLKIDFLGLKTLTSIQKAVAWVEKNKKKTIDWTSLSLEDKKAFDLLNHGKTLGVFQVESGGMQELVKQLHVDLFEEIIAVGALYRPGPMDMIPSFIQRKHGREAIDFEHPLLKEILSETYGVMVYQEQVMQIASKLAGYSLGEGDVLRKAMGKKDRQEMEKQREKFLLGAKEKQISEEVAGSIFDKIEKFASYGFNKSHATAYGYITYVTAYLKAHFPHEWMAALMTCDQDDLSKVAKFIWECRSLKIPILPPDINEADKEFVPTLKGIRFAMAGIKGLGMAVVEAVLEERKNHGPFLSLYDFIQRIDLSRVGKKNIEIFIDAGAFDFTKWSRDALRESVEPMFDEIAREKKDEVHGVLNFFSLISPQEKKTFSPPEVHKKSTLLEILQREKELLGFYLTSHPMDSYHTVLQRLSCVPLKDLRQLEHDRVFRSAFLVEDITVKISNKNQKKFAILEVSDGEEKFELPIWSEMYENKQHLLQKNKLLYVILQIDRREDSIKLQCRWLEDLTLVNEEVLQACDTAYDAYKNQAQASLRKKNTKAPEALEKSLEKSEKIEEKKKEALEKPPALISMKVHADKVRFSEILQLKNLFRQNPGKTKVELQFISQNKNIGLVLIDAPWGVKVHEEMTKEIKSIKSVISLIVKA